LYPRLFNYQSPLFIAVVPHSYLTHYQCSPQACFEQCSSVRYTIVHSYLVYNTMRLKRIQVTSFKTIISLQLHYSREPVLGTALKFLTRISKYHGWRALIQQAGNLGRSETLKITAKQYNGPIMCQKIQLFFLTLHLLPLTIFERKKVQHLKKNIC